MELFSNFSKWVLNRDKIKEENVDVIYKKKKKKLITYSLQKNYSGLSLSEIS